MALYLLNVLKRQAVAVWLISPKGLASDPVLQMRTRRHREPSGTERFENREFLPWQSSTMFAGCHVSLSSSINRSIDQSVCLTLSLSLSLSFSLPPPPSANCLIAEPLTKYTYCKHSLMKCQGMFWFLCFSSCEPPMTSFLPRPSAVGSETAGSERRPRRVCQHTTNRRRSKVGPKIKSQKTELFQRGLQLLVSLLTCFFFLLLLHGTPICSIMELIWARN